MPAQVFVLLSARLDVETDSPEKVLFAGVVFISMYSCAEELIGHVGTR